MGADGRFLDEFEEFVSRLFVHAFRQPNDDDFAASLTRFECQLPLQVVAFLHIYSDLLVFGPNVFEPFLDVEVRTLADPFAPFLQEVVRDRLVAALPFIDRKGEVKVWMSPDGRHLAVRTSAASTFVIGVLAQKHLRERQG